MDSCPPLLELLKEIMGWYSSYRDYRGFGIPFNISQLETVMKYSLEVQVDSDFSSRMCRKLSRYKCWQHAFTHPDRWLNPEVQVRVIQIFESFLQGLGELFKVPRKLSGTDNTFTQNTLVAGFITFLIRLVDPYPGVFALSRFPHLENLVVELRFLVTILWDSPFQVADPEHVQSILDEFELVANEAGILMHFAIFGPIPVLLPPLLLKEAEGGEEEGKEDEEEEEDDNVVSDGEDQGSGAPLDQVLYSNSRGNGINSSTTARSFHKVVNAHTQALEDDVIVVGACDSKTQSRDNNDIEIGGTVKGDDDGESKGKLDTDEFDGLVCPICFEAWSSGGDHLACCSPCNHTVQEAFGLFLERVKLLKTNIIKFLDMLPNSVMAHTGNGSLDALFIVDSLLLDLKYLMNQNNDTGLDVKNLIKMFYEQLTLCQPLLIVPQCTEIEELMKEPILQVISMAYDAEYLIKSFLVGDAPLWYLTIRLTHFVRNIQLNKARLQEMKQDYDIADLQVVDDFSAQLSQPAKKDSLVSDIFVDFDQQKTNMLDLLLRGPKTLQLIFTVGMAGIGKTTLAKKVYEDSLIGCHFDRSSWCIVSQHYYKRNLLVDILICIRSDLKEEAKKMDEERLKLEIYQCLKDRRYLIVLDDIWDSNMWNDLWRIFPDDVNGSRILFASRNKDFAPCGSRVYEIPFLSNVQCWELLKRMVFHNNPCPPVLLEIGKRIAANCYGLPLAVVVIAGILSTMDKEERAWESVRQSLGYRMLSDQTSSMMQILKLSYTHLPSHLKPCFLYFGVFEGSKIGVRKLTQLWVAEGFVREEEDTRAECVAERYLMELINKNLVIVSERRWDGGPKICIIHDLVLKMCLTIAQKENFLKWSDENQGYNRLYVHKKPVFRSSPPSHCPRSIFFSFQDSLLSVLNQKLRRVMNFRSYSDYALVDPVRYFSEARCVCPTYLRNLRYLFEVRCVCPTYLHILMNLEFLISHKIAVLFISSNVLKLVKLRYMSCWAYFDDDCDLSQTSNLEYLSNVLIRIPKHLEMLKCFPSLRTLKCSYDRKDSTDKEDRLECFDLHFLIQLESLNLKFWSQIDGIKFPLNIRKLTLDGIQLPWEMVTVIGTLPYLEVLKLIDSLFEGNRWDTTDGEFVQLKILKLSWSDLVQWNVSSSQHFPKLQHLSLAHCYQLEVIPREIGEIQTLQLIELIGYCQT